MKTKTLVTRPNTHTLSRPWVVASEIYDAKKIASFEQWFTLEREALLKNHQILNEQFLVPQEDLPDDTDWTSTVVEQSMRIRLRHREALYLKKLDAALERIRAGVFGKCSGCEEDIGIKRLEARPTTTLCLTCKETQERREEAFQDGLQHKSLGRAVQLKLA